MSPTERCGQRMIELTLTPGETDVVNPRVKFLNVNGSIHSQ